MKKIGIILSFLFLLSGHTMADVRIPKIFSDNMILQQGMKIPIWGWADPGQKITVVLKGEIVDTVAGFDGKWKLYVGPLHIGGPFDFTIEGKNTILLKNVLVGEVWVCSGQSNMAMEVRSCKNAQAEIATANYPQIRLFQVKRTKAPMALDDVAPVSDGEPSWLNKWQVCSPLTVADFSGVGFFFARELWDRFHIPVGLISASWGGTTAEAWIPKDTLANDRELVNILHDWPEYNNDEQWLRVEYDSFVKDVEKAHREGKPEPLYFNQPAVLYNGIVSPIVSFGIRGIIWYQGESNAYRAHQYGRLFPALIQKWRHNWGQGDFPFLFVQLANYKFEPQVFPELREAQAQALSISKTAMVVTIDVGDSTTIHPENKQEVARRLSLAARKLSYGEDLTYSGPLYKSMIVMNGKCRLSFSHMGEGLIVKGAGFLVGFEIAGVDRHFYRALAVVEGDQVVVSNAKISDPVAVRYAWSNSPGKCNFYNKLNGQVHLPAAPFRTDDWPGITLGGR